MLRETRGRKGERGGRKGLCGVFDCRFPVWGQSAHAKREGMGKVKTRQAETSEAPGGRKREQTDLSAVAESRPCLPGTRVFHVHLLVGVWRWPAASCCLSICTNQARIKQLHQGELRKKKGRGAPGRGEARRPRRLQTWPAQQLLGNAPIEGLHWLIGCCGSTFCVAL